MMTLHFMFEKRFAGGKGKYINLHHVVMRRDYQIQI
jgi:hypothetical protein